MTQPLLLPGLAEILDIDVPRVDAEYAGFITRDPVKRQWAIACEPHVMRMLKRFFERIPKETPTGVAPLADSPANAKTLLWFMAGQPLKVSEADMAHLRTQAQIEATRQRGLTRVLTGKYSGKVGEREWSGTMPTPLHPFSRGGRGGGGHHAALGVTASSSRGTTPTPLLPLSRGGRGERGGGGHHTALGVTVSSSSRVHGAHPTAPTTTRGEESNPCSTRRSGPPSSNRIRRRRTDRSVSLSPLFTTRAHTWRR